MREFFVGNKLLNTVGLALSLVALSGGCTTVTTAPKPVGAPTSWTEKVTASVKSGTSKMTAMISPKPKPGTEAASATAEKKPGPSVFVALAQVNERNGNLEGAELQYQKALKLDPTHLGALVGYARLEDGRNNFDAATKLYNRAIKKHPEEASVYNDLGLCYHRRGRLPEATKALEKAVELQPARRLFRGNLAAVLVEQGKTDAALTQLVAAHGEAVGHYNLAYLLTQKKDNKAAIVHFQKALEKDPSMTPAREWLAQLSPQPAPRPSTIETLPPTGTMVATTRTGAMASLASRPHASPPPWNPQLVAAASPEPVVPAAKPAPPTPKPAPPTAKPADVTIRAEVSQSNSRYAFTANSSTFGSELHFLSDGQTQDDAEPTSSDP
jgi:Tfp pilus assembly protein PilF